MWKSPTQCPEEAFLSPLRGEEKPPFNPPQKGEEYF